MTYFEGMRPIFKKRADELLKDEEAAIPKQVDALKHDAASRKNIPTAEMESFFRRDEDASPMAPKHYPRARPLAEAIARLGRSSAAA